MGTGKKGIVSTLEVASIMQTIRSQTKEIKNPGHIYMASRKWRSLLMTLFTMTLFTNDALYLAFMDDA